ncbi:MAG: Eco57I restriction-modification methylase domain-containing protein, partial [Gammaproteobacteria bacterium]
MKALDEELNHYVAVEYRVDSSKKDAYSKWLRSHQPFHWFVEFYGIISGGGFDVIIGNPPYVELNAVRDYALRGFECEQSGNLYALIIE